MGDVGALCRDVLERPRMNVCEARASTTNSTKDAEMKGMGHANDASEGRHYMPHTEYPEGWGSSSAGNVYLGYEFLTVTPQGIKPAV